MRRFDADRSGSIDFREFVALRRALLGGALVEATPQAEPQAEPRPQQDARQGQPEALRAQLRVVSAALMAEQA